MSKNKYIGALQVLAGAKDTDTFLSELKEQNKLKVWDYNPIKIDFDKGVIIHNAEDIKNAVGILYDTLTESLKNESDIDVIDGFESNLKIISDWLKGTRLKLTSPIDELKKEFIANENVLKSLSSDIKAKRDKVLEDVYKCRRVSIFNFIQILEDDLEHNLNLDLRVFGAFADTKKILKGFDLNTKGVLSASAQKQIKEQFEMVVNPLIEAKKLNKAIEIENNILTKQLSLIKTSGTNEELNDSITSLNEMMEQVDLMFINIKDGAINQIKATINIVQANLKANEKVIFDARLREEDFKIYNQIKSLDYNTDDINVLSGVESKANDLLGQIHFSDVKSMIIDYVSSNISNKIVELKKQALKGFDISTKDVPRETIKNTDMITYSLSEIDIEFLSTFKITANSQKEAKDILIARIGTHLSMCDLLEVRDGKK